MNLKIEKIPGRKFEPNFNNTKANGNFEEWVRSVAREIERLLDTETKGVNNSIYAVMVGRINQSDKSNFIIKVYMGDELMNSFSLSEEKFDLYRKQPRRLQLYLSMQFIDFIWELCDIEQKRLVFLSKFGMKYTMQTS